MISVSTGLKNLGRLGPKAAMRTSIPRFAQSCAPRAFSTAGEEDTVVSRCTQKIQDALEPQKLQVTAAHDDPNGSHIRIHIISDKFEGKRSVMRQRMVYKAIWQEMEDGGPVHAVDEIVAKTPEEASS